MAKKSSIEKNKKRMRLVEKYAPKRTELKRILRDPSTPDKAFYEAQRALTELPRDSSKIRVRNRCAITGRPRAYIRRFGFSRITFRELASDGKIPGVTKSSW
jgi:small subunit ribosomal protein S14